MNHSDLAPLAEIPLPPLDETTKVAVREWRNADRARTCGEVHAELDAKHPGWAARYLAWLAL